MNFIDSHCHLPNLQHKDELEKILTDGKDWDMDRFINIVLPLKRMRKQLRWKSQRPLEEQVALFEAQVAETKRKNEPKYVRMVGQKVAEVREISLEQVALQTRANAYCLFGLKS